MTSHANGGTPSTQWAALALVNLDIPFLTGANPNEFQPLDCVAADLTLATSDATAFTLGDDGLLTYNGPNVRGYVWASAALQCATAGTGALVVAKNDDLAGLAIFDAATVPAGAIPVSLAAAALVEVTTGRELALTDGDTIRVLAAFDPTATPNNMLVEGLAFEFRYCLV